MEMCLSNQLLAYPSSASGIRRAPDRGYTLTPAQAETALKNALCNIPKELHEALAPEFMDELLTRGRVYGYRYPYELVTYGETGQVCQNWMQYRLIKQYLEILTGEQTLVIESGHPLSLFKSRPDAPRVIITNSMMIGMFDNQKDWHIAARMPLAAYNVNLGTNNLEIATYIAKKIRFIGGDLRYCKAMSVELKERGIVQVSINMTDYTHTALYRAFELVKVEARRYGVPVVGSEFIGLVPIEALIDAASYYLGLENFSMNQVLEARIME